MTAQEQPRTCLVQPLDTLRERLLGLHGTRTWRDIQAAFYPTVPAGTLASVAKGRDPQRKSIRVALGLPVDPIPLATPRVCACGCGIPFLPRVPNQKRLPGHPRRRTRTLPGN